MSRTCGMDIKLYTRNHGLLDLLNILLENGWRLDMGGEVWYLALGDVDDFDWQTKPVEAWPEVHAILEQKVKAREPVWVMLRWDDTDIGGSFSFEVDGESKNIGTSWHAERPTLPECDWLTDNNWYVQRIVPPLLKQGIQIWYVECSDLY